MNCINLVVAFGTLDQVAFDKSYRLFFDELKEKVDFIPSLLNEKSSAMSHIPLFKDVLSTIEHDTHLNIFPLILNEGREFLEIESLTECFSRSITPPLLSYSRDILRDYLMEKTKDLSKTYVILGHGSQCFDNSLYFSLIEKLNGNVYLYLHHQNIDIKEKEITTIPLMFTCGRHIQQMNQELSKTYDVSEIKTGLLEDDSFRKSLIKSAEDFFRCD